LTGSFQTIVIQGYATSATWSTPTSAVRSGATVPAMPSCCHWSGPPEQSPRPAPLRVGLVSTALLTDQYELTMVSSARRDGSADRRCVFEVFARRLPAGRRYGVVAGTERLLTAIEQFRFDPAQLEFLARAEVIDADTAGWLAGYRFTGDVDGYQEGELYFPGSPLLTVSGPFAETVVLETLALSVLNHDSAVASAAARMVTAAAGRPIIEMGGRRTHEDAAVAAARAAYLAGFAATSNLAAGHRYGVPTAGTAAHAFVLLHDSEAAAFRGQVDTLGPGTTLLVDTYDIAAGIRAAVAAAGPDLGAIRIDSGELTVLARRRPPRPGSRPRCRTCRPAGWYRGRADRKSTRLNSSHSH